MAKINLGKINLHRMVVSGHYSSPLLGVPLGLHLYLLTCWPLSETIFLGKLNAQRAFTRALYHRIKSYFTSKLTEHKKQKQKRIRIFDQVASWSVLFKDPINVVCLIFELLSTSILRFF